MKLTAMEEYGLRCLVQMARAYHAKNPVTIPEIAEKEGLSTPYAGKIMSTLRAGGLVSSARGRAGGYTLSRNPRAITLDETLSVLGGRLFSSNFCEVHGVNGDDCIHSHNCTLRPVWGVIEMIVGDVLKRMSLDDLLEGEQAIRDSLSHAVSESMMKHLSRESQQQVAAGI